MNATAKRIRSTSTALVFMLWGTSMLIVCASLMVSHWVPLPVRNFESLSTQDPAGDLAKAANWKAYHFMYSDCPCSIRVLNHILCRGPLDNVDEIIVLVDGTVENRKQVECSPFQYDFVTAEELQNKFHVEVAPLLVVTAPNGSTTYSGAYTSRKQGFAIQDVDIIRKAQAGQAVDPLPVYGCAVSRQLKTIVDPLGLKKMSAKK